MDSNFKDQVKAAIKELFSEGALKVVVSNNVAFDDSKTLVTQVILDDDVICHQVEDLYE